MRRRRLLRLDPRRSDAAQTRRQSCRLACGSSGVGWAWLWRPSGPRALEIRLHPAGSRHSQTPTLPRHPCRGSLTCRRLRGGGLLLPGRFVNALGIVRAFANMRWMVDGLRGRRRIHAAGLEEFFGLVRGLRFCCGVAARTLPRHSCRGSLTCRRLRDRRRLRFVGCMQCTMNVRRHSLRERAWEVRWVAGPSPHPCGWS